MEILGGGGTDTRLLISRRTLQFAIQIAPPDTLYLRTGSCIIDQRHMPPGVCPRRQVAGERCVANLNATVIPSVDDEPARAVRHAFEREGPSLGENTRISDVLDVCIIILPVRSDPTLDRKAVGDFQVASQIGDAQTGTVGLRVRRTGVTVRQGQRAVRRLAAERLIAAGLHGCCVRGYIETARQAGVADKVARVQRTGRICVQPPVGNGAVLSRRRERQIGTNGPSNTGTERS